MLGHHAAERPWIPYHEHAAPGLASLVGADAAEVVAMNSLTVNLHLMMVSFFRPHDGRNKILIEKSAFPSDRYAVVSQLEFHGLRAQEHLIEIAPRPGEQTLRTQDGWIFLMCMTDKFWLELVDTLGRPDLKADPRFATPGSRGVHREALTQTLDEELSRHPTSHWLDAFKGRLPAAPVLDVATALESEFVAEADMVRQVPHPNRPDFRVLSNPLKIDGERLELRVCSPLGADGDEGAAVGAPSGGPPSR